MTAFALAAGQPWLDYLKALSSGPQGQQWVLLEDTFRLIAARDEIARLGFYLKETATVGAAARARPAGAPGAAAPAALAGPILATPPIASLIDFWSETLVTPAGRLADTLYDLRQQARTEDQRRAYDEFDLARDLVRRQLFPEAIDRLQRAIRGADGHPGHGAEPRFHFLLGRIWLGNARNADPRSVDLAGARAQFLLAARHFLPEDPANAALSLAYAARAACCAGDVAAAQEILTEALRVGPGLAEAHFLAAKLLLHAGRKVQGLEELGRAMVQDRLYALAWQEDADFLAWRQDILGLVAALRDTMLAELRGRAADILALHERLGACAEEVAAAAAVGGPVAFAPSVPHPAAARALLNSRPPPPSYFSVMESRDRLAELEQRTRHCAVTLLADIDTALAGLPDPAIFESQVAREAERRAGHLLGGRLGRVGFLAYVLLLAAASDLAFHTLVIGQDDDLLVIALKYLLAAFLLGFAWLLFEDLARALLHGPPRAIGALARRLIKVLAARRIGVEREIDHDNMVGLRQKLVAIRARLVPLGG